MDNLSGQSGQGKSSSTGSVVESKILNVDPHGTQKEKNCTFAGRRLTQEMLDFYY